MALTNKPNTLVVLLGPTGIGKTDLSIELAKTFNTEIISCDSRQMYRELSIGTAVPEAHQLASVQHHFIGNLSIHDYYSSGVYELQAIKLLANLFQQKKHVIMTGGSGLYIDAVVKGIDDLPSINPEVRGALKEEFETKGIEYLKDKLEKLDPEYYEIADLNNPKRILKALEVFEITGKKYSTLRTQPNKKRNFNTIQIGLTMDREELYNRINLRVEHMLEAGLVEEAHRFHNYKHLNSLNTVGYKELFAHFDGEYDLNEAIRLIKRNSRRYAKRQLTYWNRDKSIHWFLPSQKQDIVEKIQEL
ncbi:MAG: tRNA (adenosine(37)-N6)-dimethylallyltransferase MiaA [Salinivirgaceae bacterium]|jgi:tRNA dimethylallyltransferase|nr:tRNA (adenosine(37)-N6)-dimethylallyltransferase MiaA [Salinivirgaceae bacterium]